MGTRSIITFIEKYNDEEHPLVSVYQQFDGYLEGVGRTLCNWLLKKTIINGIGIDQRSSEYANGFGCLAAQFVHDFKVGIGNLYITRNDRGEEDYNYEVICDFPASLKVPMSGTKANELIKIRVHNFDEEPFFEGSPKELLEYIKKQKEE